jgi:predicted RNA-binding Zn-ribbon protein involved in translation (DUF1610 family)
MEATNPHGDVVPVPQPQAEMSPPVEPPTITAVADDDDDDLICIACGTPIGHVADMTRASVVCPACGKTYRVSHNF